jgi:hypothetical protein
MWGTKQKLIGTCEKVTEPTLPPSAGEAEPKGNTTCCGNPMTPRSGQGRDRLGQVVFVATYCCSACGRVTF